MPTPVTSHQASAEKDLGVMKDLGQVVKFDAKERVCLVNWLHEGVEEEMGVFQIRGHPDYSFQISDLVARLLDFEYVAAVNEDQDLIKQCKAVLERRSVIPLENHERCAPLSSHEFFSWSNANQLLAFAVDGAL